MGRLCDPVRTPPRLPIQKVRRLLNTSWTK
jgi:hypothetical protein